MQTCGAKTRSGTPCNQPAGWGTDHLGEGRCKLHGGSSPGRPIKHGRYSVKHREKLAAKVSQFRDDPEPSSLADELAMMRALFEDFLDKNTAPDTEEYEVMFEMLEAIGRLVQRIARIYNETALTAAEIKYFQSRVADILVTYIDEPERRRDALAELRESIEPRRFSNPTSP